MSDSIVRQAHRAAILVGKHVPNPLPKLKIAVEGLRNNGVTVDALNLDRSPLMPLAEELEGINNGSLTEEIAGVVFTMMQAETFNDAVRKNAAAESTGEEYLEIAESFNSLHQDLKRQLYQAEKGRVSMKEKLGNKWMMVRRGDIQDRYKHIIETLTSVQLNAQKKIHATHSIMGAYEDYRGAVKEAMLQSERILEAARHDLDEAKATLEDANNQLNREDLAHRGDWELQRDNLQRTWRQADRRFQLATDLCQNLTIAYHTSNAVMGKTLQIAQALERIWSQSVTFLATNSGTLTTLQVAFSTLKTTSAMTNAHKALKKGVDQQLKDLANTGTKIQMDAIREGYAPNVQAETLQKLISSIVDYSTRVVGIIEEARAESEANHENIKNIAEKGSQQVLEATLNVNHALKLERSSTSSDSYTTSTDPDVSDTSFEVASEVTSLPEVTHEDISQKPATRLPPRLRKPNRAVKRVAPKRDQ